MVNSPTPSHTGGARDNDSRAWTQHPRKRVGIVLMMTLLGAGSAGFYPAQQPNVYEACATIEYDVSLSEGGGQASGGDAQSQLAYLASQELIRTQNYILASRSLAERVVRKLALEKKPSAAFPGRERQSMFNRAVEQLQASVQVISVAGTRAVALCAQASRRDESALIANTVVDAYMEKSLEDRAYASARALTWLRDQETYLRREVEASELAVLRFREAHHSVSASLDEHRRVVSDQFVTYNAALTDLRIKRVHAQARLGVLKEALDANFDFLTIQASAIAADPVIGALRERYRNAQVLLQQLALAHSSESYQVVSAQAELDAIRIQLELQLDSLLKGAHADLKEVERAEAGLRQALSDLHDQSVALSHEELEFVSLEHERASQRARYKLVLERAAKANLANALGAGTTRVIDRARPSATPLRPRVERAAGVGGLVGLALGALLVIGSSELWRRRSAATI